MQELFDEETDAKQWLLGRIAEYVKTYCTSPEQERKAIIKAMVEYTEDVLKRIEERQAK